MANKDQTRTRFEANGIVEPGPLGWQGLKVIATFQDDEDDNALDDSIQANITTDVFTYAGQSAQNMKDHVASGNIFEKIPYKITAYDSQNSVVMWDGFKNLTDRYTENLLDDTVSCGLSQRDDIKTFTKKLNATTFGLLETNGTFTASDYKTINYSVQQKNSVRDIILLTLAGFQLGQQAADLVKNVTDDAVNTTAHSVGGITGPAGGTTFGVGAAIFNLVYAGSIILAFKLLGRNIRDAFFPPLRQHKVASLRTLMSKVCQHLGFDFNSTIPELDFYHLLPANTDFDTFTARGFIKEPKGTQKGIPDVADGELFNCGAFFRTMKTLFGARFKIIENKVHFERRNAEFWEREADFTVSGGIRPTKGFNAGQLIRSVQVGFKFDQNDTFTIDNSAKSSITVSTESIDFNVKENVEEDGYRNIILPFSLGTIKTELSGFEKLLSVIIKTISSVVRAFGGSLGSANPENNLGELVVSSNNTGTKLLYLVGNKIPANHRTLLNARTVWDLGLNSISFVANSFRNQFAIFKGVTKVSLGLGGFQKLVRNKFFRTAQGERAQAMRIEWLFGSDEALMDYKVQTTYTEKLKETIKESD